MDISKLKYTPTHEWVGFAGNVATVGVTDHAQKEISDVVFIELPKIGRLVKAKESVMVVESVKAAFDIYSPLSGKIIKVNEKLIKQPELVNKSPYAEGWFFQMEYSDPQEIQALLSGEQYKPEAHH